MLQQALNAAEPWLAVAVVGVALAYDLALGEVPTVVHPVVYLGKVIDYLHHRMPRQGATRQLLAGAVVAVALPSCLALGTHWLIESVSNCPWLQAGVQALILTTCFAIRELWNAAARVRRALHREDLPAARYALRSLCSRDASNLSSGQLAAATVESLAENASDSITAPLLYFALFGVPGAVFYRAVNTLDAMLGYRDHRLYTGRFSARIDDLCNLVPARLTAALFLLAGLGLGNNVRTGLATWWRDASETDSPNAGHPMAAMAGLLEVRLDKPGQYCLGKTLGPANAQTIDGAWRVVRLATLLGCLGLGVAKSLH